MSCYLESLLHVVEIDDTNDAFVFVRTGKDKVRFGRTNCADTLGVRVSLNHVKHFEVFEVVDIDALF